ncbi:MAG TPA: hypothetical protein VIA29_10180 [Thermoanaerobaculia bacterium]|jgi:hypothetical protein
MFCLAIAVAAAAQTGAASAAPVAKAAPAKGTLYRIDIKGAQSVWAAERPTIKGTLIVFPRHPDKALMSLASSSVARIVPVAPAAASTAGLKPGATKDIGLAAGTPRGAAASNVAEAAAAGPTKGPVGPGSTPEGMAAMDPSRPYNPTFDGTQVPGQSVGQPNSRNDNQVGATWAYGPANATQSGPGQPPMMPPSSGDVPRGPQ